MKVGDLVRRKIPWKCVEYSPQNDDGIGLVLSLQLAGSNPVHPCASVWYPHCGRTYDIAESLIEVIND